jgi:hypothetical protein
LGGNLTDKICSCPIGENHLRAVIINFLPVKTEIDFGHTGFGATEDDVVLSRLQMSVLEGNDSALRALGIMVFPGASRGFVGHVINHGLV